MLTRMLRRRSKGSPRGQSLTEFALVFPLFIMLLVGIIVLGFGVFLHQEVTNAARDAARYAILHSGTAQCPTVSNLSPDPVLLPVPNNYYGCDPPDRGWPFMTAHARGRVFAMAPSSLRITACWSGYWHKDSLGVWKSWDQPPGAPNEFRECTVRVYGWTPGQDPDATPSTLQIVNPRTGLDASAQRIRVDCSRDFPRTTAADDMASNFSSSGGRSANRITVLACYAWNPPMAGFLLIPRTVGLQAVISEALEYQQ